MRKWYTLILEHLKGFSSFNYAERRGIAVLILLILIVEVVNALFSVSAEFQEDDLHDFQQEFMKFQAALLQPDTLHPQKNTTNDKRRNAKPKRLYQSRTATAKPPMVIEINTADSAALTRLPGIGPVFAGRILKYRGLLGGYYKPEQLLEVYGMDTTRFKLFRDYIRTDKASIQKIAVNQAEFRQLLRHPYLDYETVKDIFNYRQGSGPVLNADSLKKIIAYDPMFEKIKAYIVYDL